MYICVYTCHKIKYVRVHDSRNGGTCNGQTGFLLYILSLSHLYTIQLPCYFWNKPVGNLQQEERLVVNIIYFNQNYQYNNV